jgi:hypothetical protein
MPTLRTNCKKGHDLACENFDKNFFCKMKFKKLVNMLLLIILHFERVLISYKSLTQDFKSLIDLQIYIERKNLKLSEKGETHNTSITLYLSL